MTMKNKIFISILAVILLGIISLFTINSFNKDKPLKTKKIEAMVLSSNGKELTVQDSNNIIYTFKTADVSTEIGDHIIIEYTGVLDKLNTTQKTNIMNYKVKAVTTNEDGIPVDYLDNGIFSDYYILAYNKLKELSLDEKIGQLLLVRYPDNNQAEILKQYQFGGYVFYAKDFTDKSKETVANEMSTLQKASKIPILTAVDEEGGKVVRVSSNPMLRKEKFLSPKELYQAGGLERIKTDTIEKTNLLTELGLNLNLAPVVDVSTEPSSYMYDRTIGENTEITSEYAKTVIEASKNKEVSYTLKHFPGYGNNGDTHKDTAVDERSLEEMRKNDFPPFKAGIEAGAEAILLSHNIVNSIDPANPSSLSKNTHNILRNELKFSGVTITDDLSMGATSKIDNSVEKAILAGNDLLIVTDYEKSFKELKQSVENRRISEEQINKLAFRVLAWKYYKGLMFKVSK